MVIDAKTTGGMRYPCMGVVVGKGDRQPELSRALGEQRAIRETDEITSERVAGERKAQVGPDARRLTRRQRDSWQGSYRAARA